MSYCKRCYLEKINPEARQENFIYFEEPGKCECCGKIAKESEFKSYGGINHVNLGICYDCKINPKADEILKVEKPIEKKEI